MEQKIEQIEKFLITAKKLKEMKDKVTVKIDSLSRINNVIDSDFDKLFKSMSFEDSEIVMTSNFETDHLLTVDEIKQLRKELDNSKHTINNLTKINYNLTLQCNQSEEEIRKIIYETDNKILFYKKEIDKQNQKHENDIKELKVQLNNHNEEINIKMTKEIKRLNSVILGHRKSVENWSKLLSEKDEKINELIDKTEGLSKQNDTYKTKIYLMKYYGDKNSINDIIR